MARSQGTTGRFRLGQIKDLRVSERFCSQRLVCGKMNVVALSPLRPPINLMDPSYNCVRSQSCFGAYRTKDRCCRNTEREFRCVHWNRLRIRVLPVRVMTPSVGNIQTLLASLGAKIVHVSYTVAELDVESPHCPRAECRRQSNKAFQFFRRVGSFLSMLDLMPWLRSSQTAQ